MSRHESDREDLFAELAAAPQRWELMIWGKIDPVVAGIRRDDRFSIFLDHDECYHFEADDKLRRAFINDLLYRTEGETLSELRRHRTEHETTLLRNDLSPAALDAFLERAATQLAAVRDALQQGDFMILRQLPEEVDNIDVLKDRLDRLLAQPLSLAKAISTR